MDLKTERLTLDPMTRRDAPALFRVLGDPAAMAFWDREPLPRLATVEAQMADELAAMAVGGFLYWTVHREGDAIGTIDLSHIDGQGAWIGFAFRRDMWGQGLAREALGAVIAHAFDALDLGRLTARVQAANLRATRLLQALGFQEEGRLPDIVRGGDIRASARYGLARPTAR